ncbi:hypothetical protein CQ042_16190 [Microbacterium sp. MYb62]|nr:hypothetical protein CQ042_16190 [Microbacterium sp. MYb62]
MDAPTLPLSSWRFRGTLRTYQAEVLERIGAGADEKMHIVAPPGSGKTLLGLLLAAREGHRTLVLAPTVTIRQQWLRAAEGLAPDGAAVSEDPHALGDLTVLTYQLLSVTGDGAPFEELARRRWVAELTETGRSEADAATWLAVLEVDNPGRYRAGIRRRVRRVRRRFAQQRPEELAGVLHPNAIALIDAIVDAGVRTIVLDECHHLLDHWALVVAYLSARIRATGESPIVIGLTATLPSGRRDRVRELLAAARRRGLRGARARGREGGASRALPRPGLVLGARSRGSGVHPATRVAVGGSRAAGAVLAGWPQVSGGAAAARGDGGRRASPQPGARPGARPGIRATGATRTCAVRRLRADPLRRCGAHGRRARASARLPAAVDAVRALHDRRPAHRPHPLRADTPVHGPRRSGTVGVRAASARGLRVPPHRPWPAARAQPGRDHPDVLGIEGSGGDRHPAP